MTSTSKAFPSACCAVILMIESISLFVEVYAHREIVGAILDREASAAKVTPRFDWRTSTRGYGRVAKELGRFTKGLLAGNSLPDMLVVATDGNCVGTAARRRELAVPELGIPTVFAVPDPHIERWLLLDGAAFKSVLGVGCQAPDKKCDRDRYKNLLATAVSDSGTQPLLGGLEHARDIVEAMDLDAAARSDRSFAAFLQELRAGLRP